MTFSPATQQRLDDPTLLETVCAYVADGGSAITLCLGWELPYSCLIAWVYDDNQPARQTRYEQALEARAEWEIETILRELKRIATVDIREAFEEDGRLRPLKDIPADVAACINGIEVAELWQGRDAQRVKIGQLKKIKCVDKLRALELLGEKLALWQQRPGPVSVRILMGHAGQAIQVRQPLAGGPTT